MNMPFKANKILGSAIAAALLSTAAVHAADVEIRLGHVLAESHSWHQAALGFAEQVAAETDGRVEVRVFPSGQLGTETEVIEGLQFGSVQAAIIGSGSFQSIEPKLGIIEMPYAWSSREVAFEALDGEFGDQLAALLAEKGIVNLAWWENGYRNITNNRGPIETPEDLAGLKIRVTPDPIRLATFQSFGAEPAPLAFGELYSALQQGVFDAQENPVSIILGSSFYEVQDYLSLSEHVWGAASLVISQSVWDKISAEDQPIVKAAAEAWRDKQREMVGSANAEIIAELEEKGMEVNEVDKAAFIEAAQPIWDAQAATFGPELMSAIEAYRQ
jgi:tripartite ATP-independent transporter DctP family solute receptor